MGHSFSSSRHVRGHDPSNLPQTAQHSNHVPRCFLHLCRTLVAHSLPKRHVRRSSTPPTSRTLPSSQPPSSFFFFLVRRSWTTRPFLHATSEVIDSPDLSHTARRLNPSTFCLLFCCRRTLVALSLPPPKRHVRGHRPLQPVGAERPRAPAADRRGGGRERRGRRVGVRQGHGERRLSPWVHRGQLSGALLALLLWLCLLLVLSVCLSFGRLVVWLAVTMVVGVLLSGTAASCRVCWRCW